MSIKIERFQITDIGKPTDYKVGVMDKQLNETIAIINVTNNKDDNVYLAEELIKSIETLIENGSIIREQ